MTDETITAEPVATQTAGKNDKTFALVVYGLYLAGFFIGVTALIGVIIAYVKRGDATALLAGHFSNQIRIFWISLATLIIGGVLSVVMIGWVVIFIWVLWALFVCIKGALRLMDDKPVS